MMKYETNVKCHIIHGLEISDMNEESLVKLPPTTTVDKIPASKQDVVTREDLQRWPHLDSIKIPEIDCEVEMMIGQDVPEASEPWEVINAPNRGEPYGIRTLLGWMVCGYMGPNVNIIRIYLHEHILRVYGYA